MSHDWSGKTIERFPFWSKAEVARIILIVGLAIVPISVSAVDAPREKANKLSLASASRPTAPGSLRSVRVVAFDLTKLSIATLGDLEPEAVR